mmetsp:Transcript_41726/g.73395  ORF Transcript_41726/g.73395 Transcript_41726/m.73395 type:complete len:196 (+) Transcript_41726:53-640(+)
MLYALTQLIAVQGLLVGSPATRPTQNAIFMAERVPFMAGNWKCNTVLPEAVDLAKAVAKASEKASGVTVAVCAPAPFLAPVADALKGTKVALGGQDCHWEAGGAFTGAVSTAMLKSVGCEYVLSGHSERRSIFGDSDADVNKKTLKILEEGLKCILCIGELKEERESGETFNVCDVQVSCVPALPRGVAIIQCCS